MLLLTKVYGSRRDKRPWHDDRIRKLRAHRLDYKHETANWKAFNLKVQLSAASLHHLRLQKLPSSVQMPETDGHFSFKQPHQVWPMKVHSTGPETVRRELVQTAVMKCPCASIEPEPGQAVIHPTKTISAGETGPTIALQDDKVG